jgi:hypothetical protein
VTEPRGRLRQAHPPQAADVFEGGSHSSPAGRGGKPAARPAQSLDRLCIGAATALTDPWAELGKSGSAGGRRQCLAAGHAQAIAALVQGLPDIQAPILLICGCHEDHDRASGVWTAILPAAVPRRSATRQPARLG